MLRLAVTIGLAVIPLGVGFAIADPGPDRKSELLYRLQHDCGSCHGMTMRGGLGPPLLPSTLAGKPSDGLVDVILNGIPGSPMPPWAFEIGREEAAWLVGELKKGLSDNE